MNRIIVLCSAVGAVAFLNGGLASVNQPAPMGVQVAEAQQMGRSPWRAQTRNRSLAAQYQYLDRNENSSSSGNGDGGLGVLNQFTESYTYNSSSNAVGNLNEITQILSDGSTGTVQQTTDQMSDGNQGSAANTEVAVDSTTSSTSSAASNSSSGEGDVNSEIDDIVNQAAANHGG